MPREILANAPGSAGAIVLAQAVRANPPGAQ
jgi:hypothetical protein